MPEVRPVRISVVIINYGTFELALKAVASVFAQPVGNRIVDVHLVDNASPGNDATRLKEMIAARGWTGRVKLYTETINHGFGRGNNLVLKSLATQDPSPEFVFFLNPDAQLQNAAIRVLADFLDTHPQAAVAGARIEKPGGVPVTAAFRFPGVISTFSDALAFGPVSRLMARHEVPLPPDLPTCPVDWVAGAAMLIRHTALMEVGGFDPAYFLYYEEVDLMRQLTGAGWQTWFVAEARVIHVEGVATGVNSGGSTRRRRPAYWYDSWQYFFAKNHGRAMALTAALVWMIGAALNLGISVLRRRPPAMPLHFFPDFLAFACRPLLGLKVRMHD